MASEDRERAGRLSSMIDAALKFYKLSVFFSIMWRTIHATFASKMVPYSVFTLLCYLLQLDISACLRIHSCHEKSLKLHLQVFDTT